MNERAALKLLAGLVTLAACLASASTLSAQTWVDTAWAVSENSDPAINFRESDHFRLKWGKNNVSGITVDEDFVQLNLQHAERHWHVMHDPIASGGLGFPSPSVKWSGDDGYNYRANWSLNQTWGNPNDGGAGGSVDGDGIAVYGMGPWAMYPYAPTTVPSHEYGHGILISMRGLNNTPYDGMWHEGWANFSEEQLANDIDPSNMLWNHSFFLPHGRDYYDSWVWWEHLRETPVYGYSFLTTLFTQNRGDQSVYGTSEYVFDGMTRLDTSGAADHQNAIKDQIGRYAAKNVTWDYERGDMMRQYSFVPNFTDPTNDTYRRSLTELVREPGSSTIYRVPFDQAPSQGGFVIVPINVSGNTAGDFSVGVNFMPVWDGIRQSDWRATLVAVNTNGTARYSTMWNCGVNSIILSKDETKLYLVVAATPSFLGDTGRMFLNQPAVAPQPFEVSLVNTTATFPETAAMVSSSGLTRVANGQGYRSATATVASTAYVAPNARVLGNAQVLGHARIEDDAVVTDWAVVKDNAVVSGHAIVSGAAQIYGNAKVRDWARICDNAQVYENGKILEHAHTGESGCKVHGSATEKGQIWDGGVADVSGYAIKEGDCLNTANFDHGVLMCWVWGIDQGFADSQPDTGGLYCGYSFEKPSPIYAMDTYGIIHGYLMGGAKRVKVSDSTRSYVGQLDGASNYIELRDDVNDHKECTIAMWVNWTGSATDQRIFSFGDGSGKYMYLTPKDSTTNNLRLVVTDGTTTQYIDGTAPLTANRWTHVAITFTGAAVTYAPYVASPYSPSSNKWTATATLYVDGVACASVPNVLVPDQVRGANVASGGQYNCLGKGPAGNFFKGYVDDFKVFSVPQASTAIMTLASQFASRTTTTVADTDTAAPTPATATWLAAPTAVNDTTIVMSATKGTDAAGNGVLYNFVCTSGGGHSSGWISSNRYTDLGLTPGNQYTYTVQMKDCLGNTGTVSASAGATTTTDTTPPTHSAPTWAVAPIGITSTSITMTATKGSDDSGKVEYKFDRMSPTMATSGWQASNTWTNTGLTSGTTYSYQVRMRDGNGNVGVSSTALSATAGDYAPPTTTSVARAIWQGRPYVLTDGTFWMRARAASDSSGGVRYYFHCSKINGVAQPDPSPLDSGWQTSNEWHSPTPVADGTYTWQLKIRDMSTRQNSTAYLGDIDVAVTPYTCYRTYAMSQLATLPDHYLVKFTGNVIRVASNYYVVKDASSNATIAVRPNTQNEATDSSMLMKNVTVKGHLYTYNGARTTTVSVVTVNGSAATYNITGRVTDAGGSPIAGATVYVSDSAGASVNPVKTATTDSSGNYSLAMPNGPWYLCAGAVSYFACPDKSVTINGANVGNVNFTLNKQPLISGRVTNQAGAGVAGVTVCFSTTSGAVLHPTYTTTTDSNGNYSRGVDLGTWYANAYGASYSASTERSFTTSGSPVTDIDFVVKGYATLAPLVALDASALATGSLTTWNNAGTLGGSFGTDGTTVKVAMTAGKNSVTFDGNNRMKSTFMAPSGITGNNDWSVACWAYNSDIGGEECMVSWADRNGGSRDMQFNYGSAPGWGAATHMADDLGWANAIPPAAGQWHHLVLTYAGGTSGLEQVYVDGVLNNTAYKTLNLFSNEPVYLACATSGNQTGPGWNFSGSLAGVRITDGALSASQVQDLYLHNGVTTYNVSGTVTNTGGTALANATVYFSLTPGAAAHPDATATTNSSGNYSLSLPNGTWYMASSASGYVTSGEVTTTVNNADVSGVNFVLAAGAPQAITASAGPNGSISPSGSVSVAYNGNQAFTMTPSTGYMVDTVTVDGVSQGSVRSYTFTNVTGPHTISVTFKVDPYADLLAWYKFDETSGTAAADSSGHNKTGVLSSGASWAAGDLANCVSLNGSTGYVSLPNLGVQSSFTISTWAYLKSLPTSGNLAGIFMTDTWQAGSLHCNLLPSGQFTCHVYNWNTGLTSTAPLPLNTWKHIAMVYDGAAKAVKIYIDGTQDSSLTLSTTASAVMTSCKIGSWGGTQRFVNGKFDDFRLYNRALSASEVMDQYRAGTWHTITASAGTGGTISPSGAVSVTYGANQSFTITPNAGYGIADLIVDGVSTTAAIGYTFTNVLADHTISASFNKPVGVNCRSVLTDTKVQGRVIVTWGKVKSIDGTASFVINDGYGDVTVICNGVTLPSVFNSTKTAVVTGVLATDGKVYAQAVTAVP